MKNLLHTVVMAICCVTTMNVKAQPPMLSSLPTAPAVIFIDFDGHNVDGTVWNYSGPFYCSPSGLDNAKMTTIFNRVAEDYRPFNIDVTTDSTKFLAAPVAKRVRMIVTTTSDWYGSAGGVAFVGSFTWGDDTPAFVFSALLNYNVKNIAEAVAHEAGHTLGLYHQSSYDVNCVKTSDYSYGQGVGEIGWAPIMGVGYYQNLTSWSNGPNSFGCASFQNDMDIITTSNGITFRNDDHVGTFAGATTAVFAGNQFNVSGMIGQNTDLDMIKFTQPGYGRFQLSAVPYNVGSGNSGSNLDIQVNLYNNAQTLLGTYNPGTLLSSAIDTQLNPGIYYLRIEGRGNIYAPDYASLGDYALQGNFTAGIPLALRKLELHGEVISDKHNLTWLIEADEAITKQVLEVSTDGRTFSQVTESPSNLRSFMYKPYVTTTALYRLNVTFENGRQYYSNIVSLRNTGSVNWPKLAGNISSSNIIVTSPGTYSYTIYEFSGKTISKGQLTNGLNTINTETFSGGMYLIRFANGNEQWIDKFIKQ
ncbi:MAG: zinc-dependent metalloprotease [Bacteroidota bacterium]